MVGSKVYLVFQNRMYDSYMRRRIEILMIVKAVYLYAMNRIMIIGCCGSGKSTLARKLQKVVDLPLFHLDQYYWKPNWTPTPNEEWEHIVNGLAQQEKWIIDGNYGGTLDVRFERADMIVYLDYNTITCLGRVIGRIAKYHGKVRPDMPEGCAERFDFDFIHYVATFNLLRRKSTLKKLNSLQQKKTVVRIKNNEDIRRFLEEMSSISK